MTLDTFDREYLAQTGAAQDILKRMLGLAVGKNNAGKYNTGIQHYLEYKSQLVQADLPPDDMEEVIVRADGSKTTKRMLLLSDGDAKDPQRVMFLMGYDPLQWEMEYCKIRRNYWDVTIKNKDWEGEKHTNHAYACEVKARPIQNVITTEYVKSVFDGLKPPSVAKLKHASGGMMLELPIMDFHLGKLSWAEETGEDYDLSIAAELYRETILDILGSIKACGIKIERVIFPIGQDYFHTDNIRSETTRGTRVDTDTRWPKMYKVGVELLVWAVGQLRRIAPVECMYVAGNHDKMLSYCATMTVDAYYSDDESVVVDSSPAPRKYVHYGVNLIGFSHGVDEKKRIEHLMQLEASEMWAQTKYREFHLGHIHSEHAREVGGIIFRRISSITASDSWHEDTGFKGAIRKAQAFVWDKELGKRYTIDSNVSAP